MDFTPSKDSVEKNIIRLINQFWKLIPMRENAEDWQKQLQTVIIEVAGFGSIFAEVPQFLQLLAKLQGLLEVETTFSLYRKTVFECISLLRSCLYD